ncbi:hypothetical protein [Haloactinomyces albus]|uniref:Copper(I)-binding protein n=1 Tax=Haloactinomyces albus TaxID=1352928 RepID=A0AAE3ZEB3_9ACTN|nr:hypothetical protein [Haloactinomyces albus]MDR7301657.1 copper(I)-binding protein [Haloactinomyces albus]
MSRPQHSKAGRLRLAPVAIALGATVALTGCAAGQQAETSEENAAIFGENAEVRNMAVRDATFTFPEGEPVYPAGATAPIDVVLVNEQALRSDRLLSVSSPYADSGRVTGTTVIPGGTRLYSDGVPPGASPQPPTPPDKAASGPADPEPVGPVQRPQVNIALVGLTQAIRPGVTVPVTFTFEQAGSVTVQVPIGPTAEPRPGHGSPNVAGQAQGGSESHGGGQGHG